MKEIFEKFCETIERRGLISKGDKIIAALSGGSDSVAMLILLDKFRRERPELDVSLYAFHFNHKIRGKEADDDAEFCRSLSENLGIAFELSEGDVPRFAKERKKSLEEAARIMRYDALREFSRKISGGRAKIAVAHNSNDRAETVFYNISRGTSTDGMHGIRYINGDIIRPLLDITKSETYVVCESSGVRFRSDSTNFEDDCTRNKIRLNVIPYINEELNVDFEKKLLAVSDFAATDADYLLREAGRVFEENAEVKADSIVLRYDNIRNVHGAIKSRVIRKAVSETVVAGQKPFSGNVSISQVLISRIEKFAETGENNKAIELGNGAYCSKKGNEMVFSGKPLTVESFAEEFPLKTGRINVAGKEYELEFEEEDVNGIHEVLAEARGSEEAEAVFDKEDFEKIITDNPPVIRTMREGDVFSPIGGSGEKKLRRFFTDVKIGAEERRKMPVLAAGSNILWIPGVRRSKIATIHKGTKCVIIIKLRTALTDDAV